MGLKSVTFLGEKQKAFELLVVPEVYLRWLVCPPPSKWLLHMMGRVRRLDRPCASMDPCTSVKYVDKSA